MFANNLLTIYADKNIASSWINYTFFGGFIGLLTGVVLIKPLSYGIGLVKPLADILQKLFSFIEEGEIEFLLMIAMPILSPILGIGIGVSLFQSMLLRQLGINIARNWTILTSISHFLPTFLYSILFHVPTALTFASQNPNILQLKKNLKRIENILIFIIWGSLIGLVQWTLIKEYINNSILWFLVTALSLSVGICISSFICLLIIIILGRRNVMLLFYSIGLIALIPYGFLTGKLLELSLKYK